MRRGVKSLVAVALAVATVFSFSSADVNAASTSWHLRYVKGAPTTVNIYSWSTMVTTTKSKTKMEVANMNSNSEVYIYSSNGMSSIFSQNGSLEISAKKNQRIYASANLFNYGAGNANPTGTLIY